MFQDLVGAVEPIGSTPSSAGTIRLDAGLGDSLRPLSERVRSGADRRSRHRAGERRSVRLSSANGSRHGLGYPGLGQELRDEVFQDGVLSWFEDLKWGTPLARKLTGVAAAVGFLAFCVFVLLVTFGGQAVL